LSNIANLTKQISKRLVTFAELAVWAIVSIAVYKLLLNGVASIMSIVTAIFISLIITAAVFSIISLYTHKRDEDGR